MNQRLKILRLPLIAHHQPAEVLQPGFRALDNPSPFVASPLAPILMRRHSIILPLRDDWLNLSLHKQQARRVTIIGPVADQTLRLVRTSPLAASLLHLHPVERGFKEFDFGRGSRLQVYSERSTRAIGQRQG